MGHAQRNLIIFVIIVVIGVLGLHFSTLNDSSEFGSLTETCSTTIGYWTGLPISSDNPLFHDPTKDRNDFQSKKEELKKIFSGYDEDDWSVEGENDNSEIFKALFDEYEIYIGWNGIFDALVEHGEQYLKQPRDFCHWLGEELYSRTDTPRHGIEIASRDILYQAPIHGFVWSAIEDKGLEDLDAMFSLAFDELCYFRDYDGMGVQWISCAHGVGHGLGMLKPDNIDDALDICAAVNDGQFQYACATGIFMNIDMPVDSFSPCDTSRFPAACFRFAIPVFENSIGTKGFCDTQCDPYHKMGCIYGQRYIWKDRNIKVCDEYWPEVPNQEPESLYHAVCLEGYFTVAKLTNSIFEGYCNQIKENQASYAVCERIANSDKNNFTLGEDEFYNVELLETYYNSTNSITCQTANVP